jgi:ketosteroid isomerase-like protein
MVRAAGFWTATEQQQPGYTWLHKPLPERGGALNGILPRAMSQENVEVVRRFLLLGVDEALTLADPDIVWNPAEEAATHGHDAVRDSLVRWKSEWDDYELVPEEFDDMGDRVIVAVRLRGRGRGSGVEVDARFYDVYTVHQGKIIRMDQFTQRSEALEDVALRE